MKRSCRSGAAIVALFVLLAILPGCAARYFHEAGTPPFPVPRYSLDQWLYSEYWTGIVFNGQKIGFTRLLIQPARDVKNEYEIHAEAALVLRFLGYEKKINLKSYDLVQDDLTLERFSYDYNIDGSELKLSGKREDNRLVVTVVTGHRPTEQTFELSDKLYPSSVISLYPVLHGLEVGRQYDYLVFNGELQGLAQVTQSIEGYEGSEVFSGNVPVTLTRW